MDNKISPEIDLRTKLKNKIAMKRLGRSSTSEKNKELLRHAEKAGVSKEQLDELKKNVAKQSVQK